jgi:hypothetical protein
VRRQSALLNEDSASTVGRHARHAKVTNQTPESIPAQHRGNYVGLKVSEGAVLCGNCAGERVRARGVKYLSVDAVKGLVRVGDVDPRGRRRQKEEGGEYEFRVSRM